MHSRINQAFSESLNLDFVTTFIRLVMFLNIIVNLCTDKTCGVVSSSSFTIGSYVVVSKHDGSILLYSKCWSISASKISGSPKVASLSLLNSK